MHTAGFGAVIGPIMFRIEALWIRTEIVVVKITRYPIKAEKLGLSGREHGVNQINLPY